MGLLLVPVVVACGGSGVTGPSGPANIAGSWTLSVNLTSCTARAAVVLQQSGANFSGSQAGTETCPPFGDASIDGPIISGAVAGASVSFAGALPFDGAGCVYTGTATGSPANRMSGPVTCFDSSANSVATGAWEASR